MKRKPFYKRLAWIIFWTNPWGRIWSICIRLVCKVFGHPKPYDQRLHCETCPRCFKVMRHKKTQVRFTVHRGGDG